jgi:rhamnose transport system permease protein
VKQSGRTDVKVTGLSLPNMCRPYIKSGVIESIVLWNTMDLVPSRYAVAQAMTTGELSWRVDARRGALGKFEVAGDEVRPRRPFIFNKQNIDRFNF